MLAKRTARVLVQLFHLGRHGIARQDAHRFGQAERKAAGKAGQGLVAGHVQKRLELGGDLAVDEVLQAAADLFHHFGTGFFVHEGLDRGLGGFGALHQLADRIGAPHQATLFGEIKLGVRRVVEAVGAKVEFGLQRLDRGLRERLRRIWRGAGVLLEAEAFQASGEFAFDRHFALVVHFGHESLLLLQPAKEDARPPVDKSLRQCRMQGIRQAVFYSARFLAPMGFVFDPVFPLGDVGPGADIGEAARQRVDVAVGLVDPLDRGGKPVTGDAAATKAATDEELENPGQKGRVFRAGGGAEVGDAADVPEKLHAFGLGQLVLHFRQGGERFQRQHVVGIPGAGQPVVEGGRLQAADQPVGAAEIHRFVAPVQLADGLEAVGLDRLDGFLVEGADLTRDAEGPVFGVASRPARDLGQFLRVKRAHPAAVEFRGGGKGDVLDVEVEAHADGVGGHQIVHVAVLVERHLRIPRPGAEGTHHHGAAALLAADQFRDGIDVLDREADDGRPRRHPADLLRPGIFQRRHPVALEKRHMRHQPRDGRAHGVGPQKQRLVQAPCAQQAVGKDMAPIGIGAQLDLVHRDEIRADVQGHRLGRADPVLGAVGDDPLFPRDQRHHGRPDLGDDPVIDLTRQKPQRQANDARPVRQHPLDRVMGLAGVRRPKDRRHPPGRVHDLKLLPLGLGLQPLDRFRGTLEMGMNGEGGLVDLQGTLGLAGFFQNHCQP